MNLSSFRSFKCKRIPAAILLSAIVTASPAVTYQARAEPLENEVSESKSDETLLSADESTDELTDSSVPEAPQPEPDISEPVTIETMPGQDTGETDPAEEEPVTDSSVPKSLLRKRISRMRAFLMKAHRKQPGRIHQNRKDLSMRGLR